MTGRDTTVKTRKPHECRLCGEKIGPGEVAICRSGFDGDGPWTIYLHPECEPLTKEWDQMDWESFSPGEFKRPKLEAKR